MWNLHRDVCGVWRISMRLFASTVCIVTLATHIRIERWSCRFDTNVRWHEKNEFPTKLFSLYEFIIFIAGRWCSCCTQKASFAFEYVVPRSRYRAEQRPCGGLAYEEWLADHRNARPLSRVSPALADRQWAEVSFEKWLSHYPHGNMQSLEYPKMCLVATFY